jgi:hypothetical protein
MREDKHAKDELTVFKAKKLNKKILNQVVGLPPFQERPITQCVEFDLSYKKQRPLCSQEYLDGKLSVRKRTVSKRDA